jgi:hypothetical protein
MDLAEVNAQVMSKKAYIKKWRNLTDEDADKELEQIKLEQDLFNNSEMLPSVNGNTGNIGSNSNNNEEGEDIGIDEMLKDF